MKLLTLAMVISLAVPSAASAAIHVEPDAPAGVEYSSPLDRARVEGSGGGSTAGAPGSTETAPLFGDAGSGKGGGGGGFAPAAADGPTIASPDPGSKLPVVLAIMAAVIAGGGILALVIRRAPRDLTA